MAARTCPRSPGAATMTWIRRVPGCSVPEGLSPVVGSLGPGKGGGKGRSGPAAHMRGRRESRAPGGFLGEGVAQDSVQGGPPPPIVQWVDRAWLVVRLARALNEYRPMVVIMALVFSSEPSITTKSLDQSICSKNKFSRVKSSITLK